MLKAAYGGFRCFFSTQKWQIHLKFERGHTHWTEWEILFSDSNAIFPALPELLNNLIFIFLNVGAVYSYLNISEHTVKETVLTKHLAFLLLSKGYLPLWFMLVGLPTSVCRWLVVLFAFYSRLTVVFEEGGCQPATLIVLWTSWFKTFHNNSALN